MSNKDLKNEKVSKVSDVVVEEVQDGENIKFPETPNVDIVDVEENCQDVSDNDEDKKHSPSIEELRALGLLPPDKNKEKSEEGPNEDTNEDTNEMPPLRPIQNPNMTTELSEEERQIIWDKHTNRASTALQFALAMFKHQTRPVEDMVEDAFKAADCFQRQIDNAYNQDILEATVPKNFS